MSESAENTEGLVSFDDTLDITMAAILVPSISGRQIRLPANKMAAFGGCFLMRPWGIVGD